MELLRKGYSKYPVNKEVLLNEDDISFYLLGAYMTDGFLCDKKHHLSFSICANDEDWIINVRNLLSPNKPIYYSKKDGGCTFSTSNIDCMNWLIDYGCTPNKSRSLRIEKPIPEKYYNDFIRGVLDGDGSISTSKYIASKYKKLDPIYHRWYIKTSVYICGASKVFLEQIANMIPKDIDFRINTILPENQASEINGRKITSTCNNYRLQFNDSNAKKLLSWLYYPDHKLSLNRKKELALSLIKKEGTAVIPYISQ